MKLTIVQLNKKKINVALAGGSSSSSSSGASK